MKEYNYKKKKVLDMDTFNNMLAQCACKSKVRYYNDEDRKVLHNKGIKYQDLYKLDIDKCYIRLTFMSYNKEKCNFNGIATYKFNMAGKTAEDEIYKEKIIDDNELTGKEAYSLFQKMSNCAVFDLCDVEWAKDYFKRDANGKMIIKAPDAMLFSNPKFSGKRTDHCYGYDMNSAYGYALKQPIPDVTVPKIGWSVVKKNHIGYVIEINSKGQEYLQPVLREGDYCSIQFPLMESPFISTVEKLYNMKNKIKKNREKYEIGSDKWNEWNEKYKRKKALINYAVGYSKLHNPFLQALIVGRTYNYMKNKMLQYSGHIIYCNTDSLYSDMMLDLPIGDKIGEFKLEHNDESLALKGCQYQWGNEVPTYRGLPKPLFVEFEKANDRKFDILKDVIPSARVYNGYDCIEMNIDGRKAYKLVKKEIHNDL